VGRSRGGTIGRRRGALGFGLVLFACMVFALSSRAEAVAPSLSLLWRSAEGSGEGAGELQAAAGVAANQETGHLYVVDQGNSRVDEFDAWGQFVRAWGWGVRADEPKAELQICTTATGCQAGEPGAGEGQINRKNGGGGIAVAPDGSVYVADPDNFRVEKFDATGSFLLEFGEEGTGPGQLKPGSYADNLTVGPDGSVYLGEEDRIQVFKPDGTFERDIPFSGELALLAGKVFFSLASDKDGNLYITVLGLNQIVKIDPLGKLAAPEFFPLEVPLSAAIDEEGNLYATDRFGRTAVFDADGNLLSPPSEAFGPDVSSLATSHGCDIDGSDLIVLSSSLTAFGPPPDPNTCPPPVKPPTISRQFATSVAPQSAEVAAAINPHFWPDTSFYVEYGTGKCSEGGCTSREPAGEETLTSQVVDKGIISKGVKLPGLQPGTEYHFRFVAKSSGGGPVVGGEGSFRTFAKPEPPEPCPNDPFRLGAGALLPNCRAYEMVSPVDKEGGEIFTLFNSRNERASLNQSALDGNRVTYSSFRAFAEPEGAPATIQYLASRGASGWSTKAISPPRGTPHLKAGPTLETQYRAFSGDLCQAWLVHDTDPPLAAGAPEDFANLYKTDPCEEPRAYETLTTSAPPPAEQIPIAYRISVQGISADGSHTVFRASGKLTTSAASGTNFQCYESLAGKLRLVSVLPGGGANPTQCSIGDAYDAESAHTAQLHNAVSEDGSRIYWTAGAVAAVEKGRIYLRVNGKNPTLPVSEAGEALSKTSGESNYWTASPDGAKAIFSTGSMGSGQADLYEYRAADQSTHPLAHEVRGYLGASEDASVIYLASEEALGGQNSEGDSAVAGEPNLYRYDVATDSFDFIGILSGGDARVEAGASPLANPVSRHLARVGGDGRVAVFMSTMPLTGFDNTDAATGEADAEVFRYDAAANGGQGELLCVSCHPAGAAPGGREMKFGEEPQGIRAAAQIPPWETPFTAPHVLPEEGSRVIFESYEALVPRDTNGKQDVYEWSAAGAGGCAESSFDYSPPNGGCLSLISSGQSSLDSEFVDASADGRDVFFTTASSLVPQDPGLIDLYDAREGGGFPPPPPPEEPCDLEAEACQHPGPAPGNASPASQQPGPGNVKPKPHCPKPKTYSKKKKRCVKKHHKHNKHRRAAR